MNILNEFLYGSISPEHRRVNTDSEYWQAGLKALELEEKLAKRLKGKDQKLLLQLSTANFHHCALAEHEFLDYGFRLGALLMIDLLCNSPAFLS